MNDAIVRRALVLGAGQEPGLSIALALARAGWALLLQDEGGYRSRAIVRQRLRLHNAEAAWLAIDAADERSRAALVRAADSADALCLVVRSVSPSSSNQSHRIVPELMDVLSGRENVCWITVLLCGSGATQTADARMYNTMSDAMIHSAGRKTGARALTLLVPPEIIAGELAEAVLGLAEHGNGVYRLEAGLPPELLSGSMPVRSISEDSGVPPKPQEVLPPLPPLHESTAIETRLCALLQRVLKLDSSAGLLQGGLGVTAGWDSLKQIEIILEVEKEFGVRFQTGELGGVRRVPELLARITERMAGVNTSSR